MPPGTQTAVRRHLQVLICVAWAGLVTCGFNEDGSLLMLVSCQAGETPHPDAAAEVPGSRPTFDELIDHFEKLENMLFDPALTLEIAYSRFDSRDVTKTALSGGLTLTEWHVARKSAADWYSEERFTESRAANGVKLSMLPNKSITLDGLVFDWLAGQAFVTVHPAGKSMNYLRGWELLNQLGADIYRQILSSTWKDIDTYRASLKAAGLQSDIVTGLDEPHFPACLKEHRDEHVLHTTTETVDGHECIVLEWPGHHKTWLDVNKRFAIRRRLVNFPGRPVYRYDYQAIDLIEVAPEIWMPRRYLVDHYAKVHYEESALHGRIANRSQYQVTKFDMKSDVEPLFEPRLPVGIHVDDFVRDVHYTVVDSAQDPFEAPIQGALKDFNGAQSKATVGHWRIVLVAVNVGFLLVIAFAISRRAKTNRAEDP